MNYTQNCSVCQNNFESKRPASFCSSTCRSRVSRLEPEDIFQKLERIRLKYGYINITKEIPTKETGISYSFVPSWIRNGLTLNDVKSL